MSRITKAARTSYRQEMGASGTAKTAEARWHHLERAHIVSQPDPWLHTCDHVAMLNLALRQHDRFEALGQVVRIVIAAPGSIAGYHPAGNTGRTAAGLTTAMPIPDELRAALAS